MKVEKQLEELKPIIKQLEKLGYKNLYIDFRTGTTKFSTKFSIKIIGEKSKII